MTKPTNLCSSRVFNEKLLMYKGCMT
jgi:hypothetical protein